LGTFSNSGINVGAIATAMRASVEIWFNASIQIIDPNTGDAVWDEYTNTASGGAPTVLWSGKARIQPMSANSQADVGFSEGSVVSARIQLPLDVSVGLLRKGLQIIVTDGGEDSVLQDLSFVISSAINSSYAWNRTIMCDVDVKSVSDSLWSTISGNVSDVSLMPLADAVVSSYVLRNGLWELMYETTSDVLGNFELPAVPGVDVIVSAYLALYDRQYWDLASTQATATLVNPVNHVGTTGVDFFLALT
jgi:hypothetical protein